MSTTTPDSPSHTEAFDLTPQQWQAIALLSDGQTVTAAAEAVGVHRTTIHHWRRTQPHFALALHDTQADLADHYRKATQARADKALVALDKLLDDDRTPASVRLKAVLHVLNTATAVPALDPVEAQLESKRQDQEARERRIQLFECPIEDEQPEPRFSAECIAAYEALEAEVAAEQEDDDLLDSDSELDELANSPSNGPIHHNSSFFDDFARCSTLPPDVKAAVLDRARKTLPYGTR